MFVRQCPKCGRDVFHTARDNCRKADKAKVKCRKCSVWNKSFATDRTCCICKKTKPKTTEFFFVSSAKGKHHHHPIWERRCISCTKVRLHQNNTLSLAHKEFGKTWPGRARALIKCSKSRARKKKIEHNLTEDWCLQRLILNGFRCEATNIALDSDTSSPKDNPKFGFQCMNNPSLDRINSTEGYNTSNVRITCNKFNLMRGMICDDEFEQYAIGFLETNGYTVSGNRCSEFILVEKIHAHDVWQRRARFINYSVVGRCKSEQIVYDMPKHWILTLLQKQNYRCAATGLPFTPFGNAFTMHRNSISVDRIDPFGAYTMCNVRLVCNRLNTAKGQSSDADLEPYFIGFLEKRGFTTGRSVL